MASTRSGIRWSKAAWVVRIQPGIEDKITQALGEPVKVIEKIIQLPVPEKAQPESVMNDVLEMLHILKKPETVEAKADLPEPAPAGDELRHFQYAELLRYLKSGNPIWLFGAPGGGKSYIGEQLARDVDLKFYHLPCSVTTTKADLIGFRSIANGEYAWPSGSGKKPPKFSSAPRRYWRTHEH